MSCTTPSTPSWTPCATIWTSPDGPPRPTARTGGRPASWNGASPTKPARRSIKLTPAARQGLRVLEQLLAPRASTTESRLVTLLSALHQLALDTDPDTSRRLSALRAEQQALATRIERISTGEDDVLDGRRAKERLDDVLAQAADLPVDFARVRARFAELNQDLRRRILTDEGLPGDVLDNVFRGVDLISSSDEGQTFEAFSRMVRDPAMATTFDADIRAVLDREFATTLPASTRRAVRDLSRTLQEGSASVQDTLTEFARGLRRYVLSQEYHRDRRLHTDLREALSAAAEAAPATRPYRQTGRNLELTGMSLRSIGEVSLHDPREFDVGPALEDASVSTVDIATLHELARETEIDFTELRENVNHVLEGQDSATVADVLERRPATQGVASIVGLLSLAAHHGTAEEEFIDLLVWPTEQGPRSAHVIRHRFIERLS